MKMVSLASSERCKIKGSDILAGFLTVGFKGDVIATGLLALVFPNMAARAAARENLEKRVVDDITLR